MPFANLLCRLNEASDPFQCYVDYVGIKAHFNHSLVWYPEFGGKLKTKNLTDRKDARFFYVIAKKYQTRGEVIDLYVSAMMANKQFHISEFDHQDLMDVHKDRISRCSRLDDVFETEISNCESYCIKNGISLKQLLSANKKPFLISRSRTIGAGSPEFCAIIDRFFKFCNETDDPSWNSRSDLYRRYSRFLGHDDLAKFSSRVEKFTHIFIGGK